MTGIVLQDNDLKFSLTGQANTSLISKEYILWMTNERLYEINKPTVIIYILLILFGIFGNTLVIYVFGFRLNKNSVHIYITAIAVFDTLTCFLLIYEIFDKRFPMYIGVYSGICKTVRFLEVFANGCSSLVMAVIAFDRYYKIRKPFKRLSMKMVRVTLISIVSAMLFLSWPMLLFHGAESIKTVDPTVFGTDCADDDNFKGSIYPGIYFIIVFIIILSCIAEIVIMYSLVFVNIFKWKHSAIRKSIVTVSETLDKPFSTSKPKMFLTKSEMKENSPINRDSHSFETPGVSKTKNQRKNDSDNSVLSTNVAATQLSNKQPPRGTGATPMETHKQEKDANKLKVSFPENGRPIKRRRSGRKSVKLGMTTIMLSLTALLYVLCYIPTIVVECMNAFSQFSEKKLSISTRSFLVLCNSAYFMNIGFNPIIYGVLNKSFRDEVRLIVFGEKK